MNLPQTKDQHTKDMENFNLAQRAYRSVWEVEKEPNNNNNNNNNNDHKHVAHVRAPDNHLRPSNGITSSAISTPTTMSWHNNNINNSKNYGVSIKKTPSWINDAEVKRQKRVVKYKAYAVEGQVKASLRNGFRWVKNKYCELVHGY
ncbi:hypothetical protein Patl1_24940 [Pistacia atlantica]|uniref:Uncharacterized protein n=1 Tax=Pistacia atlantica TaxID=434234 RepID=A0ACC1B043_9ROSI|nr:hypothetical protein Patl1_24940 [Pistacia atlantica]